MLSSSGVASQSNDTQHPLAGLKARYLDAQIHGDRRGAIRLVLDEGIAKGASVFELQSEVIQAAQRDIGQLWQENQISVAQEHMATAISQMALARLYDEAERAPSNEKRITMACVEGELHDLPSRLVADALDLAGFDMRFLGADVSTETLLAKLSAERPDLLALSVTMDFNLPALRTTVTRVRERWGKRIPIIVGGRACTVENLVSELGVDGTASDASAIVSCAQRLLGLA